ncbi:hypothetical protein M9Y10_021515 [Tritrichomonas musculus]|uniref:Transmembrane protein n=1 Tax=Tritrichomonas musculus TaxID=1915356 RepID=A0ABR2KPN4_9EUKA
MFLFIPLIVSKEYIYNSKGYYSFGANKDDILTFTLQDNERAFIFSSTSQKDCFSFPERINYSSIPLDLRALSFDDPSFQIKITSQINISIWIINKLFCHPNSIFVMASYEYSLDIKPNIGKFLNQDSYNYCIFSPSLLKEYRKVSFDQQKSESSSSYSKCNIYSANVLTPDYQTEGQYIEGIFSFSFFLKISIPANSAISMYQTIKMSFIDENTDYSFVKSSSESFFSTVYYYNNDSFIHNDDWIEDIKFSYTNRPLKKFSWIWIVVVLFIMIILLLLSLFIIYIVIRKRNGSSMSSNQEVESEECIPDAQSIDQFTGELGNENNIEVYENTKNSKKNKQIKSKSDTIEKRKDPIDDNPYCISNLPEDINNLESSESIDPNVIEINPYSLPKA